MSYIVKKMRRIDVIAVGWLLNTELCKSAKILLLGNAESPLLEVFKTGLEVQETVQHYLMMKCIALFL